MGWEEYAGYFEGGFVCLVVGVGSQMKFWWTGFGPSELWGLW